MNNKRSIMTLGGDKEGMHIPTPLFTSEQLYHIEKEWFDDDNVSYRLMQQAAWQIAENLHRYALLLDTSSLKFNTGLHFCIWVGAGNNGGDGWLVASYLSQMNIKVTIVEVGNANTHDAKRAKKTAQKHNQLTVINFAERSQDSDTLISKADIYIDAIFGIGLDRKPEGDYKKAIQGINQWSTDSQIPIVAIDVPSGLVVNTGQVFDSLAVRSDVTLCVVARKMGLHIKDGQDYSGKVVDIPLIPTVLNHKPAAMLYHTANPIPKRVNNAHKGSFGEVLVIGGNQVESSQGMGGAAILAASSAFAVGVGKLTVACHKTFHPSLITSIPNAMSIDLHDNSGVKCLIKQCNVVAIGMGLGRDKLSQDLFSDYLQSAMDAGIDLVIDADGLYHLADLVQQDNTLQGQLVDYTNKHSICYTPHSGEAARLLNKEVKEIEEDRLAAIQSLFDSYSGNWLLKGNGSLMIDKQSQHIGVCAVGNAGMSTAGMGDVLSGIVAGLQAQTILPEECRSLQQAVMIHALAGDKLAERVGEWATQASDMPYEIGQIMKELTV